MDVYGFRGVVGGFVVCLCSFRVVLFVSLVVHGEFFFVPGIVTEGGVGDAARIDHDLLGTGFEGGAAEIGRGGLQGIEKESGGSVVDLVGKEETHPLHERDLDRIRVFEDGQVERVTRTAGAVGVELDASLLPALVEVA